MSEQVAPYALAIFLIWVLPILVVSGQGQSKNRPNGWLYGLFLGWFGVAILAIMAPAKSEAEVEWAKIDAEQKLAAYKDALKTQ